MLSKTQIVRRLFHKDKWKRLVVSPPLKPNQIGDTSIDLRLGTKFIVMKTTSYPSYDPFPKESPEGIRIERYQEKVTVKYRERIYLHPGQFILGGTLEYLRLPYDLAATVTGRSSWGRLGITVATATGVSPRYTGILTLEFVNNGNVPVALHTGWPIVQMTFDRLETPDESLRTKLSMGKYTASVEPEFTKLGDDYHLKGGT